MTNDDFKRIFSKNLNRYLDENNKTQADLYKYMGVSSAVVSDWCNGKKLPRLDKIQSICNWLGIEKSDLLEEKEREKETPAYSAEAMEFIKLYETATPEVQQLVRLALIGGQRNP